MDSTETGTAERREGNLQRSETVAFRTTKVGKRLIAAAAGKRDELPSDWLRREVAHGLQRDLGFRVGVQPDPPAPSEESVS